MQPAEIELNTYEIIRDVLTSRGLKNRQFASMAGIDEQSLSKMLNGARKISGDSMVKIAKALGVTVDSLIAAQSPDELVESPADPGTSKKPYAFSEAEPIELNPDGDVSKNWRGNEFVDLPGGMVMMSVPLVDQYAYAGYLSGYKDPEFLYELPKFSFITYRRHGGKYIAFEVRGDSMDDNTRDAICEGDKALGRGIEKELWHSKFHLHRFEDYVIVHREGIIVKLGGGR